MSLNDGMGICRMNFTTEFFRITFKLFSHGIFSQNVTMNREFYSLYDFIRQITKFEFLK